MNCKLVRYWNLVWILLQSEQQESLIYPDKYYLQNFNKRLVIFKVLSFLSE